MLYNLIYIYISLLRSLQFAFVVGVAMGLSESLIPISLDSRLRRNKVEVTTFSLHRLTTIPWFLISRISVRIILRGCRNNAKYRNEINKAFLFEWHLHPHHNQIFNTPSIQIVRLVNFHNHILCSIKYVKYNICFQQYKPSEIQLIR